VRDGRPCPGCEGERTQVFLVDGLDCATEAAVIEDCLSRLEGVCAVRATPTSGSATVVHTLADGAIELALEGAGFKVQQARHGPAPAPGSTATVAAAALGALGFAVQAFSPAWSPLAFGAAVVAAGFPIARKALLRLRAGSVDMNALMTIAVCGAAAIHQWAEAAATVVLFSLAQSLESRSLERARRAIAGLMSLAPETALVLRDGAEERVAVGEVRTGEAVIVEPGERLPLDGIVETGESEIDQSPMTGESKPVVRGPGSEVFAGSINGAGVLRIRTSRPAAETTLARIIRRVEEAQASRAPSQGFVDRFARIYTPAVVALAAGVAVLPPLTGHGSFHDWVYSALVLLVIACPCALVISTPVSIVSALTRASRRGVLVKGGAHLEEMATLRAVIFDKTGTLTEGSPRVRQVIPVAGHSVDEILRLAAAVEARGRHPIGKALVDCARERAIPVRAAESVTLLPGRGVRGRVDGEEVLLGSHRLFDERGLCDHSLDAELERLESAGATAILVGREGRLIGVLGLGDEIRPGAAEALAALRREGLETAMLTGDNQRTAEAIAGRLGITEWRADLLPEDKVASVERLQARWGATAMVGDGVNDAPALASARVGIAMGRGTDAALETADVALMGDDLRRIPETVRLGRATRRVVRQNIAVSLLVKAAVLALALAGHGSLWAAVAADMGASLLVVANGLRLLDPRYA
jgi:Zn2+/Cd2+-exporting ATPase